MEKIIVVGGGGHAKVIISILKKLEIYNVVGFTDKEEKGEILGIPFLGSDEILKDYFAKGIKKIAIGLGQIKTSLYRRKVVNYLKEIGFEFPAIISNQCIINENVKVGYGSVIMDGVVINSGSKIGDFSIINTNSSIDHDCKIGNYVHIAPGVTLSGNVKIDDNVLIGTGANVIQGISISSNSLISAGSSVQKSISIAGIYRGVPANIVKRF